MEPAPPPFVPETFYHVYHHANGNDNLFRTVENYRYFLHKYAEYIEPVAVTYAYCLMPNHFHLLIRVRTEEALRAFAVEKTAKAPLSKTLQGFQTLAGLEFSRLISQQFAHLLNGYTQAYNKMYNRKGSLFQRNIRRKPIRDDAYLTAAIRYIHHNPVHHGFVADLPAWPHSSYQALASERPTRLARAAVRDWFGSRAAFVAAHAGQVPVPLDFEI